MTTVNAKALKKLWKNHGKECPKRKALRRPQKTDIEGADVTDMLWQNTLTRTIHQ